MKAVDYTMQWRYPGGYCWLSRDRALKKLPPGELILSTGLPAGTHDLVSYQPPPDLFLLFANTPTTPEAIKAFADSYGLLGLAQDEGSVPLGLEGSADRSPVSISFGGSPLAAMGSGELLSAWQLQIQTMRQTTDLWTALREAVAGRPGELSHHVKWLTDEFVYYDSHPHLLRLPVSWLLGIPPGPASAPTPARKKQPEQEEHERRILAVIASKATNKEWLRLFRARDPVMPAKYYLQKSVNEQLKGRISPRLLWNVRRNRPHDLALHFVPNSLLGLLWLQMAEAINGNRQFRQCASCKTWMLISPESHGKRLSRLTCSDACRMKVYYGRILEARKLRREGLSPKRIAKTLHAKENSVRDWIKA